MNATEKLEHVTALLNSIPFSQRAASRPIREALEILAGPTDESLEVEQLKAALDEIRAAYTDSKASPEARLLTVARIEQRTREGGEG